MSIAFKPEEAIDATKEFTGQIVGVDYSEEPFGMKGAADIQRRGKVLGVMIQTEAYSKPQYEWYPPSKVKKTKWVYFIEALYTTGAIKDITIAGKTDDERVNSLAKSLLGMNFKFMDVVKDSLVREKGGAAKTFGLTLPVEYHGKTPIVAKEAFVPKEEHIGDDSGLRVDEERFPTGADLDRDRL